MVSVPQCHRQCQRHTVTITPQSHLRLHPDELKPKKLCSQRSQCRPAMPG